MKKVRDKLIDALSGLGYDISLQGSYEPDSEIPESFITYWIQGSEDVANYDNMPFLTAYNVQVAFYSKKMSLINTVPDQISSILLKNRFTRDGAGIDAGLDKDTGHYGWIMEFYITERNDEHEGSLYRIYGI